MPPKVVNGGAMRVFWLCAALCFAAAAQADDVIPFWAYPVLPPQRPPAVRPPRPVPDPTLRRVPGSTLAMTLADSQNSRNAPDWHPEDHPPAPPVIFHGGTEEHLEACAHCHLPNGLGTLIIQAPSLAGLPADYIVRQMEEMHSGARRSALTFYGPARTMNFIVQGPESEDWEAAADYFAGLTPKPWFRVVESATVPANRIDGMMYVTTGGPPQELGERIIELPDDMARMDLRDDRSGFVAYVPPGSVKKGERLVTTGGKAVTTACTSCHGPDLRGLGPVPALAGRSPSYIVRQLTDFQQSTRDGVWSALMRPVVAGLTTSDMVAIAAYTASREP